MFVEAGFAYFHFLGQNQMLSVCCLISNSSEFREFSWVPGVQQIHDLGSLTIWDYLISSLSLSVAVIHSNLPGILTLMPGALTIHQTSTFGACVSVCIFNQEAACAGRGQLSVVPATREWRERGRRWRRAGWQRWASRPRDSAICCAIWRQETGSRRPTFSSSPHQPRYVVQPQQERTNWLKSCSHCGLQQGTLGARPEPSLSFTITVIFIQWEREQGRCQN